MIEKFCFFNGLVSLFVAYCINVVLSVLGLFFYIFFIQPEFIQNFEHGLFFGSTVALPRICLAILFEGIAGSVIMSFIIMQYWKGAGESIKSIKITNKTKTKSQYL